MPVQTRAGAVGFNADLGPAAQQPAGLDDPERGPRPRQSGGSHAVTSIESENPNRPSPLTPANPQPGRGAPASTRIRVSGIQSPYAAKSVTTSHTVAGGAAQWRVRWKSAMGQRWWSLPASSSAILVCSRSSTASTWSMR